MLIVCDGCQGEYPLNIIERRLELGVIEVGHLCRHCGQWTHSFYTNLVLKEMQAKLARYRQAANKSARHLERYQQFKLRYQQAHNTFNGNTGPQQIEGIGAGLGVGQGIKGQESVKIR